VAVARNAERDSVANAIQDKSIDEDVDFAAASEAVEAASHVVQEDQHVAINHFGVGDTASLRRKPFRSHGASVSEKKAQVLEPKLCMHHNVHIQLIQKATS
jgi:hypothetical protein